MKTEATALSTFWIDNQKLLKKYLYLLGVVAAAVIGYLLIEEKFRILGAVLLPIITLLVITRPKLAMYQFIFFICTNYVFWTDPVILYVDLSALLVILTALFDFLLKAEAKLTFPKLTMNFVCILTLFVLVSLFGYNPLLGVFPLMRILMLAATFVSLYRLSGYFDIRKMLGIFFWVAVFHAVIALLPYIGAGRSNGFLDSQNRPLMT